VQQQAGEDGVQTNGFTGTGSTRDQQVRHAGQIRPEGGAVDIFPQRDTKFPFVGFEVLTLDHLPQADRGSGLVLNLNPHIGLSGNRSFDGQLLDGKLHRVEGDLPNLVVLGKAGNEESLVAELCEKFRHHEFGHAVVAQFEKHFARSVHRGYGVFHAFGRSME